MEWCMPITILPGIGLLILSTSNIIIDLNKEIKELEADIERYKLIVSQKLSQLKKVNYSLVGMYLSSFLLVVGGVVGEITENEKFINTMVLIAIVFLCTSIFILIFYSIKSLKIRQRYLKF